MVTTLGASVMLLYVGPVSTEIDDPL